MHFQVDRKNTRKTKSWILSLSLISFFIFYIIVWILVGEIDVLNLKWFITPYQKYENNVLITRKIVFNPNIIYICLGIIAFSIIYFLLFKFWFKKINWDCLPFIVIGNVAGLVLIFTGFIPYNSNNQIWIVIARFIIIIVSSLIAFFIVNSITSRILLKGNDSAMIYEEIKDEYQQLSKIKKENKMFVKPKQEKDYIEINNED